ncbi:hypothetical protein DFH11DRAFT_1833038 [Phellopilus nigrolimitatus]|nr:hypothetical protein DFH11DRAFT_1833038 [Phellopilus nigrolimitatus]
MKRRSRTRDKPYACKIKMSAGFRVFQGYCPSPDLKLGYRHCQAALRGTRRPAHECVNGEWRETAPGSWDAKLYTPQYLSAAQRFWRKAVAASYGLFFRVSGDHAFRICGRIRKAKPGVGRVTSSSGTSMQIVQQAEDAYSEERDHARAQSHISSYASGSECPKLQESKETGERDRGTEESHLIFAVRENLWTRTKVKTEQKMSGSVKRPTGNGNGGRSHNTEQTEIRDTTSISVPAGRMRGFGLAFSQSKVRVEARRGANEKDKGRGTCPAQSSAVAFEVGRRTLVVTSLPLSHPSSSNRRLLFVFSMDSGRARALPHAEKRISGCTRCTV